MKVKARDEVKKYLSNCVVAMIEVKIAIRNCDAFYFNAAEKFGILLNLSKAYILHVEQQKGSPENPLFDYQLISWSSTVSP